MPRAAWVDAKREEIARLAAELRSIQSRVDAPLELASPPRSEADTPASIVPLLETMLAAAIARIDAEAAAAHERTDAVVAGAVLRAGELQRSVDVVHANLLREPLDITEPEPFAPAHLRVDHLEDPPDPWQALEAALPNARPEALASVVDLRDPAEIHDAFWREVLSDRPMRTRLRRWRQGQPT